MHPPLNRKQSGWAMTALYASDLSTERFYRGSGMPVDGQDPVSCSETPLGKGATRIELLEDHTTALCGRSDICAHDGPNGTIDRPVGKGRGGQLQLEASARTNGVERKAAAGVVCGEVSIEV